MLASPSLSPSLSLSHSLCTNLLGDEVHLVIFGILDMLAPPSLPPSLALSLSLSLSLSLARFAQGCLETKYTSLIGILDMLGDEVHLVASLIGILDMFGHEIHLVDWNSCLSFSLSLPPSLSLSRSLCTSLLGDEVHLVD